MAKYNLASNKQDIHIVIFSGFSDQNYLNDVIIALNSFTAYGVSPQNIHCFVPTSIVSYLNQINRSINAHEYTKYSVEVPKIQAKYLINLVTGHGSPKGIQYKSSNGLGEIKPYDYFNAVHSIPTLELGVFVLGQCFAGIFNFWESVHNNKNYVFIGATGTHSSLNSEITTNVWVNVFLYFFSTWFSLNFRDKDVNGDSVNDLLDCFKYAGAKTSQLILKNRSKWYREIRRLEDSLSNPHIKPLDRDNALSKMNEAMDALYSVQEPWILNANQAREIVF